MMEKMYYAIIGGVSGFIIVLSVIVMLFFFLQMGEIFWIALVPVGFGLGVIEYFAEKEKEEDFSFHVS